MKELYFLKKEIDALRNQSLSPATYRRLAGNCIRRYFYVPNASEQFVSNYLQLIELLLMIEKKHGEAL